MSHKARRWWAAPRTGEFFAADQVGRHAGVEHVGVGPMFMHPAPRVAPIIVYLAAERMAAETPEVLVALCVQVLVADHDIVDVGRLVAEVVEPGLVAADAEEGVMVD